MTPQEPAMGVSDEAVVRDPHHDGACSWRWEGNKLFHRHVGQSKWIEVKRLHPTPKRIRALCAALPHMQPAGEAVACEWYGQALGQHHYIDVPGGRRCTKCKHEIATPPQPSAEPQQREARELLRECYEWLFESRTDGPRVSEGAIAKGYYTEAFADFHNRLNAALTGSQPQQEAQGAVAWFDCFNAHVYFRKEQADAAVAGGNTVLPVLSMDTPPAPVDWQRIKLLLDDNENGKLRAEGVVQGVRTLYELALLSAQQPSADARNGRGDRLAAAMRYVIDDMRVLPWVSSNGRQFITEALRDYDTAAIAAQPRGG